MGFGKQLKEVAASVLPIVVIASVLGWIFGIFTLLSFAQFLFSALLVVLGLTLFLLGVNVGFLPVGNHLGAMITQKRNVPLLVFSGIGLGILITLAEPDVKVLADQVASMKSGLSSSLLVFIIAIGVGIFMAISYVRALTRFSLKITMAIGVALMFLAASFVPEFFVSVGFDSGGATTGPMAVPFIMALGMGVASVHGHHEEDSFGYTGIASIGPVLAILIFGAFMGTSGGSIVTEETVSGGMLEMFGEVLLSVTKSLLPLVVICILVQVFFMKLPRIRATRMYMGILYSYVGITLFLFAVESTFMDIARTLGRTIASVAPGSLIPIGLVLGACVVLAEPAIWVLTEQVEEVSEGKIKRFLLLAFIAIGVACAVMLSMIRVINGTSIWYFLLPGYAVIVALLPFVPTLFVGIGFDSGGVATGPMSSTFLLPFVSGAAAVLAEDPSSMAFGMIGLIAMMPILAIEILGLVFSLKVKKGQKNVEEKMIKGKMLFAIVNKGDASKVMDAIRLKGAWGGTILNAHGTAPTSILSMLGLGDSKKEILLSMLNESIEKGCLESLGGVRCKGVVALLGEKGENDMKEDLVMIQVICENGYADDIMDAARREGAKGGTVIKGHGTAKEDDTRFFGYPITAEKEVLVIVEEKSKAERIIKAIDSLPFLKQKGKAVIFSLPVSHFSTIG